MPKINLFEDLKNYKSEYMLNVEEQKLDNPSTVAEVPCTKTMKDGGVIKKEELHVEGKDTTTLKVTIPSATSDKHEPQWVSVTLKVENVKEVKVTPNDKSGKPIDSPKTTEVVSRCNDSGG